MQIESTENPKKCIRIYCQQCAGSRTKVKQCLDATCPLYPWRRGVSPNVVAMQKESTHATINQ